jgi:hypothetical protein
MCRIVYTMFAAQRWLIMSSHFACRSVHGACSVLFQCRGRSVQRAIAIGSPLARSAGRAMRTATTATRVTANLPRATAVGAVSAGSASLAFTTSASNAFPEPRPVRSPRILPLPRCVHGCTPLMYCLKRRQRHLCSARTELCFCTRKAYMPSNSLNSAVQYRCASLVGRVCRMPHGA